MQAGKGIEVALRDKAENNQTEDPVGMGSCHKHGRDKCPFH